MAQLLPDLSASLMYSRGYWREIDVLRQLQRTLPDGYEIFHSVDWHSLHHGQDCHGEIDLVVMNPAGALLLVEVKSGEVELREGSLYKRYDDAEREVGVQIKVQYAAMRQLLKQAGIETALINCLVLPDFTLGYDYIVAIPRERIFDASDFPDLADKLQQLLPPGDAHERATQLRAFLSNHLNVVPDVAVMHGQLKQASRAIADGLATWVPRMQAPSNSFRIQATAGSGKTQLALKLLGDAAERQQRARYVCFNRPLADHMAKLAPACSAVSTFHALCIEHLRQGGATPDFTDAKIFDQAATAYLAALETFDADFDVLIVDEAQDFEPAWVNGLLSQLRDEGRFYLLEDSDQSLYPRTPFDVPDAVSINCMDNFRSPQRVCHAINAFGLSHQPVRPRSPWVGDFPEIHQYDGSVDDLLHQTGRAIDALLARHIPISDIAVLSFKGHAHSALLQRSQLAGFQTRRYAGTFTVDGVPAWTDGEVLLESVYRFKGQSAPAVILTEVDFEQLSRTERAKLFVGMTRGLLSVSLVVSNRVADRLAETMAT